MASSATCYDSWRRCLIDSSFRLKDEQGAERGCETSGDDRRSGYRSDGGSGDGSVKGDESKWKRERKIPD